MSEDDVNVADLVSKFYFNVSELKQFDYVGTQEHFTEDLNYIASLLNWSGPLPQLVNRRRNRQKSVSKESLDDNELDYLRSLNAKDIALYEAALDLRQQRIIEKAS